jgi:FtsH-binding integral membrane protein
LDLDASKEIAMLVLSFVQVSFAAAALAGCIAAAASALRGSDSVGFHLMLAGASAAIFFLSVPGVAAELPLVAVVTVVTGMLLAPRIEAVEQHETDLDIGESTATRRLRK